MDAFKLRGYLISSRRRRHETNDAVLSGIARLHRDLARAHGPAVARTKLRLLRAVVSDVGIVTRARLMTDGGMPEADRATVVSIFIDSKLAGIKGIGSGVAVLPNLVGIFLKREIR